MALPEALPAGDVRHRYANESDGLHGELDQVIHGLPSISPDAPALQLSESRGILYLAYVALTLIVFGLTVELVATLVIQRVGLPRPDLSDPESVLLHVHGAASRGRPYVLLLGDSVMGGGALTRAFGRSSERFALGELVRRRLSRDLPGAGVADLSMDGALANDYAGLSQLVLGHTSKPAAALLQLDYRVLSPVHDDEQNLSRQWLADYVPGLHPTPQRAYGSPEFLRRPIDEAVQQGLLHSSAYLLLRGGRSLVNAPVVRALEGQTVPEEADAQVLRLLVQQFYGTSRSVAASSVVSDLMSAVDLLTRNGVPVLVSFTPANFAFLGSEVNAPVYLANVAAFESATRARASATRLIRLANFEGEISTSLFIDHCHLTAAGNRQLADRLADELQLLIADTTEKH
jgi:hypothetical protein